MTVEKIYQCLTTKKLGVYKGTSVDATDGKIKHTLFVEGEEKEVSDSTFKRWWKLVEETTPEDLEESMESLNQIKDTVLSKEPTIEDLKQLNESGGELTEEELQLFKEQAQQQKEETVKEKPKAKKEPKQREDSGVAQFFETTVFELGGSIGMYSEPMKRVVKDKAGKTVMFYAVRPNKNIKIFMKEQLDTAISGDVQAEEKHTYPKQFPFRLSIIQLDDRNKQLLKSILELHI